MQLAPEKNKEKAKLQVQIDKDLLSDGKIVLDALGLNQSNFITMVYKRLVAERKLPFDTTLTEAENNKLTILMESRKMKHTVLDSPEKVAKWAREGD